MRIGLVLEQFDPARGGREQWTWSFTQRLLELGHEVHVVARSCSATALRLPITYHPIQCDPSPIVFAGAVRAAHWVVGKPAGLYDMLDVLGLR